MKPLFSLLILIVLIGCTQEPVKKEAKIDFDPFEDNLIATFSRLPNEKYMTCKFDPNETGKFPKPEQWAE